MPAVRDVRNDRCEPSVRRRQCVTAAVGHGEPAVRQQGCRPLVSTQVAAGFNLALGRGSQAGQTIDAQGPRGALATNTFSRGFNAAVGARSTATQRILNQVGH